MRPRSSKPDTQIPNLPIEMIRLDGGSFVMGLQPGLYGDDDAKQWDSTLSPFYIGKYEVTQGQYREVMGTNPSQIIQDTGQSNPEWDKLPVDNVSWFDTIIFCNRLSIKEGLTPVYQMNVSAEFPLHIVWETDPDRWLTVWGPTTDTRWREHANFRIIANADGYRLPTEAQWEYACRAETTCVYNFDFSLITSLANYYGSVYPHVSVPLPPRPPVGEPSNGTMPVGSFPPNAWGLYDMHGNVAEWVWDMFGNYPQSPRTDWFTSGFFVTERVHRGGGWSDGAIALASGYRSYIEPWYKSNAIGFRVARIVKED